MNGSTTRRRTEENDLRRPKKPRSSEGASPEARPPFSFSRKAIRGQLYERRPLVDDGAHVTPYFGELVCSNSLKSAQLDNACGLLKEEMRKMSSLTMAAAQIAAKSRRERPLGGPRSFRQNHHRHPRVVPLFRTSIHEDVSELCLKKRHPRDRPFDERAFFHPSGICGEKNLSFFDASAPIVEKDSIDFSKAYLQIAV
jgi:methylenetetrahydrofolate--tRNA-(uracil-5-)-methyltransferase